MHRPTTLSRNALKRAAAVVLLVPAGALMAQCSPANEAKEDDGSADVAEQSASLGQSLSAAEWVAYVENLSAGCRGVNAPTTCKGQVTSFKYEQGPRWGANAKDGSANCGPGNERCLCLPGAPGCDSPTTLSPVDVKESLTFRDTGAYTTRVTSRDAFFNPTATESFSSYYRTGYELAPSAPVRSVKQTYHNAFGRPVPGDPEGNTYHLVGLLQDDTVEGLGTVSTAYLPTGRISTISRYGRVDGFTYDGAGNVSELWEMRNGARNVLERPSDYKCGRARKTTDAFGNTASVVLNDDCHVLSETDHVGNTFRYEYDADYRVKTIHYPRGAPQRRSYPDLLTDVWTRGNHETTIRTDALGRDLGIETKDKADPSSVSTVSLVYGTDGQVRYRTQAGVGAPGTFNEEFAFDVLGRPIFQADTTDGAVYTFGYAAPDTVTATSPNGLRTRSYSQTFGDPNLRSPVGTDIEVSPSKTVSTRMTRDLNGKLLSVTQGGATHSYTYDATQALATSTTPERGKVLHTHIAGTGYLASKQYENQANKFYYEYDTIGRITHATVDSSPTAATGVFYTYDASNRLTSVRNSEGVTNAFVYDANGNKTRETLTIDGRTFAIDFTYDENDHLVTSTYPDVGGFAGNPSDRNIVRRTVDGFGRVVALSDSARSILDRVTYAPASSNFQNLSYGNGVVQSTSEDASFRPGTLVVRARGTNRVALRYSYDRMGNISRIEDFVEPTASQEFQYDGLDRLVFSTRSGAIQYSDTGDITRYQESGKPQTSFSYDPTTRRLAGTTGGTNRSYTYSGTGDGSTQSDGQRTFVYNRQNVAQVLDATKNNALIANYVSDASDLRVKKALANGETTYYVYSGQMLVFEASPTKGTREYLYLGSRIIAARRVAGGVAQYVFHHTAPGRSIIAVSDLAGTVFKRKFNPFGSEIDGNAEFMAKVPESFASQPYDSETGLFYMQHRYYDPRAGRFLAVDPVDFSATTVKSFNAYSYAGNEPILGFDPTGEFTWDELQRKWWDFEDAVGPHLVHAKEDAMYLFETIAKDPIGVVKRSGVALWETPAVPNPVHAFADVGPLLKTAQIAIKTRFFSSKAARDGAETSVAIGNRAIELGNQLGLSKGGCCVPIAVGDLGYNDVAQVIRNVANGVGVSFREYQALLRRNGLELELDVVLRPENVKTFLNNAAKNKENYFIRFDLPDGNGHAVAIANGIGDIPAIKGYAAAATKIEVFVLNQLPRGRPKPPPFFPPPPGGF